jgi:hypothetical protein
MRTAANRVLTLIFIAVVFAPLVLLWSGLMPASVLTEKRRMALRPPLPHGFGAVQRYPRLYERYFNDQFGLRSLLVRAYMQLMVHGLRVPQINNVIIGQHGWLYYAGNNEMADYQRTRQFDAAQLARVVATQQRRHEWLRQRGIAYVVFIAPNKSTVYPEHMLPSLPRAPGASRMEQAIAALRAQCRMPVVDVRDIFNTARAERLLYLMTDSHWNEYGALLAQQAVLQAVGGMVSNVAPIATSACAIGEEPRMGCDLAYMLGLQDTYHDTNIAVRPLAGFAATNVALGYVVPADYQAFATEHPNRRLPRAVIFRDSFGNRLNPFLAECFSRCVFLWTYDFDADVIEREQPDVVIYQLVERVLDVLDTTNVLRAAGAK